MLRNGGHPTSAPELSKIPLSPVLCLLLFAHRKLQVFGPQLRQKDSVKNIFPVVVIYFFFFSNKVHAKFCSPLSSHKCERTAGKMWFFEGSIQVFSAVDTRTISAWRVCWCFAHVFRENGRHCWTSRDHLVFKFKWNRALLFVFFKLKLTVMIMAKTLREF